MLVLLDVFVVVFSVCLGFIGLTCSSLVLVPLKLMVSNADFGLYMSVQNVLNLLYCKSLLIVVSFDVAVFCIS